MSIFGSQVESKSFLARSGSQAIFPDTSVPRLFELAERRGKGDKAEWKETKIRVARGEPNRGWDRWVGRATRETFSGGCLPGSLPSANPFFWQHRSGPRFAARHELLFRWVESRPLDQTNVAIRGDKAADGLQPIERRSWDVPGCATRIFFDALVSFSMCHYAARRPVEFNVSIRVQRMIVIAAMVKLWRRWSEE